MARLLLVDDYPANLRALEAVLAPLGHAMVRATGGREALDAIEQSPPDLVLLDVMMPDVDGIEVLRRIRARRDGGDLPVVLVTARSEHEHRLQGLRAGADDFLEKPFDPAVLVARVQTLLGLKAARDDLASRHADLQRLYREQRELSELIIHDLKNPLSAMQVCLSAARRQLRPEQERAHTYVHQAADAAMRMQALVGDLLLIARLEHPDAPLRRERLSLRDLLNTIADAHATEAEVAGVQISVATAGSPEVRADPVLLRRLVENLVENALRHTPRAGHVALTAQANHAVEVAVSNSGRPIPTEARGRIFEKFWHGDAADGMGHAGLGLYFCKRAAQAHGGAIEVVQTTDWPTSFVVTLPTE